MDFILQTEHSEHDASWIMHSSLHGCPVCLGCIVETIENSQFLPLQKKPALTEFLRLLNQQTAELLQLFMQEERIVWHVVSILLENLNLEDDSYLAASMDVLLKMVQLIGSEDLVTAVLDKIVEQVEHTTDHKKLQPHYTLLGKMLYQLPALARTLMTQYEILLEQLSMDLCNCGETIQSAIAYIFIFLCDGNQAVNLVPRTLQQVQSGILNMLSTSQALSVQINALGLLKKLIADKGGCHSLMTLKMDGVTLLTCMKKLLLSKKEVLQTGVSQILSSILWKEDNMAYASTILESDIVEFLFETLHTENTVQIECILKVLQKLSNVEQFYKRCHSVYGLESILRSIRTALELKHPTLLTLGYALLSDILHGQPEDIPLFLCSTVVMNCLSVIHQGLGHHQTPVAHTAHQAFSALLRKKYLLSPVPFQELTEMFSLVRKRKQEQMNTFWNLNDTRQTKNMETLITSLERYLALLIKSCQLVTQCREDLTSCDSNFAAPGTQEVTASTETFTEMILEAGCDVCKVLTMKCGNKLENPQLYMKIYEFFCSLNDIEDGKTYDLVYQLITAGFINSVIDVKVKYDSAQLTGLTEKFLNLTVACCQRRAMLPADTVLQVNHFRWSISSLPQVFSDEVLDVDVIQSYLLVLYISCKYGNNGFQGDSLQVLPSIINRHIALEQLSALGRKHYIYMLSYMSTYEGISVWQTIPNGLESLPSMFQGPVCDWYTHDTCMLEWVFGDPVLAGTSGQPVVEAFLTNTNLDMMQEMFDTVCDERDVILRLCQEQTFLRCLVTCLADTSAENVLKISLVLEKYISNSTINDSTDSHVDAGCVVDVSGCSAPNHMDFMFETVTRVLHDVFLQNYPQAQDDNLVGLLQLMLVLLKSTHSPYSINVKVVYHVLNVLSKRQGSTEDLERACMLTILAAVANTCEMQTSVCGIVLQHEAFMDYLQDCFIGKHDGIMYSVTCDVLVLLIQTDCKCIKACLVDIVNMVNSVCNDSGDCQVASMNLLSALFNAGLTSPVVTVSGRIFPTLYRTLYIQLQQSCLQDRCGAACGAVECMRSLLHYLNQSDQQIGEELLSQPWNKVLLDVVMDLASAGPIMEHQLCLLCLFTEFDAGCRMIISTPGLLEKLMKTVELLSQHLDQHLMKQYLQLLQQIQTHLEDSLTEDNLKWLKENQAG